MTPLNQKPGNTPLQQPATQRKLPTPLLACGILTGALLLCSGLFTMAAGLISLERLINSDAAATLEAALGTATPTETPPPPPAGWFTCGSLWNVSPWGYIIYPRNIDFVLWDHEPQGAWLILRLNLENVSATTLPSPGCLDYGVTGLVDGTRLTYTCEPGASQDVNSIFDAYTTLDCGEELLPRYQTSTFLACDVDPHVTDLRLLIDYYHSYSQSCRTVEIPVGDPPTPDLQDYWESVLDR